jgi:hypothetical protein
VRHALEATEFKLAGVEDPEAPELGAPTPENISALGRALEQHRADLEANEKRRHEIRSAFLPILRALEEARKSKNAKRKEQGLPQVNLFLSEPAAFPGYSNSIERLARSVGELTPQRCRVWLSTIGCAPVDVSGAKQRLYEIRERRARYAERMARPARSPVPTFRGQPARVAGAEMVPHASPGRLDLPPSALPTAAAPVPVTTPAPEADSAPSPVPARRSRSFPDIVAEAVQRNAVGK